MKKLSFFLMAMLISAMSFAQVVTFSPANETAVTSQEFTLTSGDVTLVCSSGTITADQFRFFKNQTVTISSTGGNIVSVEFTCTASDGAKYGPGCFTTTSGDYTYAGKVGTWTGEANEVTFTASSNQVRATQIVVTVQAAATDPDVVMYEVAAEECTVGAGYGTVSGTGNYAEGSTVTLTAKPNPGYVFDSWDNGSKENPLTLTVTGYIYQCATFIPQAPITIAEALQLADGETGVLNYFTVTYVNGANIYIEDESGYALAYQYDYGLKAGDGVNFMAFTKSTHNGIPQLIPATAYEKLTIIPGEAPAIAEITAAPTVADNRLVKLMNASLAGPLAVKKTTVATCADESTINIYSQIDFTPEEGKTYNILGGVTQYKNVIQIQAYEIEEYVAPVVNYNIYLTAAPSEGGEVEGEGEFEAGEQVTVSALANEGYEFVNWTEGEEVVSTNANYTFEVTAERDLVANFQPVPETVYFINNDNWEGDIYAYAWKEGGSNNGEWPGVLATKLETPYAGFEEYDAYSYTALYGQYDYVIFTNGSQQTIDHPWVGNAFYYIEKGPAPEPETTWTVAGSSTAVFGTAWDPANVANDMTLQNDGTYKWEKKELIFAAGDPIEFKVVKNHAWGEEYPMANYVLTIDESGIYTLTITFNPATTEVAAVATKTGDAEVEVEISYVLMGVQNDWETGIALTRNEDNTETEEYMLLGQEILEGDAVKVVTLRNGEKSIYCDKVNEASPVEYEKDGDNNIVLKPGKYDFYYKVAENIIYIGGEAYPEAEVIAYELNGGVLPAPAVPTQEELWASFKTATGIDTKALAELAAPVLNTIGGLLKGTTWYEGFDVLEWQWLKNYIQSVQAAQAGQQFVDANGTTRTVPALKDDIASDDNWRFAVAAFFAQSQYVGWPAASADFTEAGKPEAWGAAYQAANELVLPTEPVAEDYVLPTPTKEGYIFVGWYDNAAGEGDAYEVIPAGWSGTLYAIWEQDTTTALENIAVEGKAVKAIINGQLIIIKNGVQYNAQGQVVK